MSLPYGGQAARNSNDVAISRSEGLPTGSLYSPGSTLPLGTSYFGGPQVATIPGFTPDYSALIQAQVQPLKDQASAQGIANAAARGDATKRALIQLGLVPDLNAAAAKLGLGQQTLGFLNEDVTPDVAALAQQNTANGLSTEARLQQAHDRQTMQMRNTLAARGALSSGELPYQSGLEDTAYAQSQSDAVNAFLNAVQGYQNTYLTGQNQLGQGLADAYMQAYQTQSGLPQNQPIPGQKFSYNAQTGKYMGAGGTSFTPYNTAGGWVVVDDNGQAFVLNSDGTIGAQTGFTPPPTQTPAAPAGGGGGGPVDTGRPAPAAAPAPQVAFNANTAAQVQAPQLAPLWMNEAAGPAPVSSANYGGATPLTSAQVKARNTRQALV